MTTLAQTAERLREVKEQITALNKEASALTVEKQELEANLMQLMDDAETDQVRVKGIGTFSVRETIVPTVTDWDAFYKFMLENNALFMLERRASAAPFRDYLELHEKAPPGVESFTKRTIGLAAKQ